MIKDIILRCEIKRYLGALIFLFLLLPGQLPAVQQEALDKLVIFYSPGCHYCIQIKQKIMPEIEQEFKGKINFEYRDISQLEDYKLLLGLLPDNSKFEIPLFYFKGEFITPGKVQARLELRSFIYSGINNKFAGQGFRPVDLVSHFKNFIPAAIIFAGLSDGVNPCAFTVIVFFISFLALQGYRKRELILIGLGFILAVFLTYLGLGLGVFNFFYRFSGFWAVARLFNLTLGVLSIVFGVLAVYDFIKFKQTASTEGLILQLPKPVKERIHQVVGFFYRRSLQEKKEKFKPALGKLLASALLTGFLVSLLEAVCTGQVYLPTLSFILKSTEFKLAALGYLLLYNFMFIVPLIVIFVLALLGTSSQQFSGFLKKYLGLIKIMMAILFFSLGVYLLWRG